MGAADRAVTHRDRTAPHLVDVECLQCSAHPDHVDDRIERTDLVEFDIGRLDAVDRPLDLAEPPRPTGTKSPLL